MALKDPEGTELLNNHCPLFISLKCLKQVEKLKYCDILEQRKGIRASFFLEGTLIILLLWKKTLLVRKYCSCVIYIVGKIPFPADMVHMDFDKGYIYNFFHSYTYCINNPLPPHPEKIVLNNYIHLMLGPEGKNSFVFARVLMFPEIN